MVSDDARHRSVLIEDWLPIRELSIESIRERAAANDLPPLSFLHVWWARAPIAAANGVTLAACLPPYSRELEETIPELADALDGIEKLRPDLRGSGLTRSERYQAWVLWMSGIRGDVLKADAMASAAASSGKRLSSNPFSSPKAYKVRWSASELAVLHKVLRQHWGRLPAVLDPTAGGGTLPLTSLRYRLPTFANDVNAVAVGILEATLGAKGGEHGRALVRQVSELGERLAARCRERLAPFFPHPDDGTVTNYLYANTVACPRTGHPVPLAPNWWLDKSGDGVAARPRFEVAPADTEMLEFEIVRDPASVGFDPDAGTLARGTGTSPWDGLVIDSEYIKAEAQAGRMWPTLYCVRVQRHGSGSYEYRAPSDVDKAAVREAAAELKRLEEGPWGSGSVLPDEPVPLGNDERPLKFGMNRWRDMFTERQLLVHGVFVEEWRRLFAGAEDDDARTALVALAMMQNKALNWNSRLSSWNVNFQRTRSTFDRHDFSFKWTFSEMEGISSLVDFSLPQILTAFNGLCAMMDVEGGDDLLSDGVGAVKDETAVVTLGSGSDLEDLTDESIELVNIDPPYYDNVQYSELSDFFYVWEKKTIGLMYPDRFKADLSDKDNEAVANPARFAESGRRRKELATFDYQQKMRAIFQECRRVLVDDGVMIVWFTHKRAEAWDTLGVAMMEAGFTMEASWPISTQPQHGLHHAKKNSAKSTVMLVCRKRAKDSPGVFFEDIEAQVRRAAVEAVERFRATVGVGGVDLLLATYGPTLSVISHNWPVLSDEAGEDGRARQLRPEEALDVAREEVNRLVKARLVGHAAQFDDATDFWLLCWANFQAREFPYDEARKLGMSTLDVDDAVQAGLVKKKAGKVELVKPASRGRSLRSKMADNGRFPTLVDALHHLLNSYRDDGLASTRTWLADSGYGDERAFLDTLQASVNAIPRVRTKKGLSVPEAQELEDVVIALFGDKLEIPAEVEELIEAQQTSLEV